MVCPQCNASITAQQDAVLPPGTVIGKNFEIDYALGQGGFGITYKAIDHNLERYVAIKEFFPCEWAWRQKPNQTVAVAQANQDIYKKTLGKFEQEGRILARLNHPGIVRVYALFRERNTVYLAMELLEGRTLYDQMLTEALEEEQVAKIAKSLALSLHAIHKMGIQHLDIKPDNIMLTNDGRIVLYDFGAARWDADYSERLRPKTVAAYTPGYAPLELLQTSQAQTSPATDIFELSVVIYEMLTRQRPPDVLERLNTPDWRPQVPERWQNLLTAGLALYMDDRPASIPKWWKLYESSPTVASTESGTESGLDIKRNILANFKLNRSVLIISASLLLALSVPSLLLLRSASFYAYMARMSYRNQDFQAAIDYYNQAIARNPNDVFLRQERAEANFQAKNYLNAARDWEDSYRITNDQKLLPKIAQAYFNEAESNQINQKFDLAVTYYQKAKEYDSSLTERVDSKIFDISVLSAKLKADSGDYQSAIDSYKQLMAQSQSSPSIMKELRIQVARAYLGLGQEQENRNEIDNAIVTYTTGLTEDPNYPELYEARATAFIKKNELQRALSDYNRSISLDKTRPLSFAGRGFVLGRLKNLKEALSDYDQAIKLGLTTDFVFNGRGWIHHQMKSFTNAISDYSEAIQVNPNYADAYLNRGWSKYALSDYMGAINDFNRTLEINDSIASAHEGLGFAKTLLKDNKEIILEHLDKAVELYSLERNEAKVIEIEKWIEQHKLKGGFQ